MNPPASIGPGRLAHLDSLRGLAALLVAFYHSLRAFADIPRDVGFLSILNGHTAVMFFFMLSGFVLSRSLDKSDRLDVATIVGYWIRRLFRLYPVVVAAVFFAALSANFYSSSERWAAVAPWVAKMMELSTNLSGLREYASLLCLHVSYLNAPLWTIKAEIICSILLPLLLLPVNIFKFARLTLSAMIFLLYIYYTKAPDFADSTRYLLHFFLGYTTFRLSGLLNRIPPLASGAGIALLFLSLCASNYFNFYQKYQVFILWALFCLLVPCRPDRLRSALHWKPVLGLGHISYSFYALHWPVMLLCLSFMQTVFPADFLSGQPYMKGFLLFAVSAMLTVLCSLPSVRFVETPFNHLGHALGGLISSLLASKRAAISAVSQ